MSGSWTTDTLNVDLQKARANPPSYGFATLDLTGLASPQSVPQATYLNGFIKITGTLTANMVLKMPLATGTDRYWRIQFENATTGAFSLTIEGPTGGSGIVLTQGKKAWLQADTSSIIKEPEF